jgi:hypothetical protein
MSIFLRHFSTSHQYVITVEVLHILATTMRGIEQSQNSEFNPRITFEGEKY